MEADLEYDFFIITPEMRAWINNHRIHRDFAAELNHRLTLDELRESFLENFPNAKDCLDFRSARYIDEQLCGLNNCGGLWRQAYGFPGEVNSVVNNGQLGGWIRIISTGIFTFSYEAAEQPAQ